MAQQHNACPDTDLHFWIDEHQVLAHPHTARGMSFLKTLLSSKVGVPEKAIDGSYNLAIRPGCLVHIMESLIGAGITIHVQVPIDYTPPDYFPEWMREQFTRPDTDPPEIGDAEAERIIRELFDRQS